jgi:hypothetical protein
MNHCIDFITATPYHLLYQSPDQTQLRRVK